MPIDSPERWIRRICGDAGAAAKALLSRIQDKTLACDANREERAATIAAEKESWEKELSNWIHENDDYSLDMIEEPLEGNRFVPQVAFENTGVLVHGDQGMKLYLAFEGRIGQRPDA